MLKTIWKYFKYFVLALGFFTLSIILYISISFLISQSSQNTPQENKLPTAIYNKNFGEMQLAILREDNNSGQLLINISRGAQQLITNYAFPAQDYDWDWPDVADAKVIPLKINEYGVIVITENRECDHCDNGKQIWIFKLSKELKLVKTISLFDLHQTADNNDHYFATRLISIPYQEKLPGDQIFIPVEITLGTKITLTPMLNQHSIGLLKEHWENFIEHRIQKLSDTDKTDFLAKLKQLPQELNESLAQQVISY